MLWLALYCPQLALDAIPHGREPSAVLADGRILVANEAATAGGIRPGLKLSSALGILPGLLVYERDSVGEVAFMERMACWAGSFTPHVSLAEDILLLEVSGSIRLFDSLQGLQDRILAGAEGPGINFILSGAPSPLAASWLAVAGEEKLVEDTSLAREALAALPLHACRWPGGVEERLKRFGLSRIGQLMALPRAELGARLGKDCLLALGRALGEIPDPRPWYVFPETFSQALSLPFRVEEAGQLIFAYKRLVATLCGWLKARGAGIVALELKLQHEGHDETSLILQTAGPTRDEQRLLRLLQERLGRWVLKGPVYGLSLLSRELVPLHGSDGPLFQESGSRADPEGVLACVERIQARLGEGRVTSFWSASDYRPEMATRRVAPGKGGGTGEGSGSQPLWLLPAPQALQEQGGRPWWDGALELLHGPERIESGWWDEDEEACLGDARRDYFTARNPGGKTLWIYRDSFGWFLHGLFS